MTNNVSNFGRYFWIKNRVRQHLAWRGLTDAEIRAAVLHGIYLIANGQRDTAAFYRVISVAARQRTGALRQTPKWSPGSKNRNEFFDTHIHIVLSNLREAMKCLNQKPKVRQLFTNNQQPQTTGPGAA